MGCWLHWPHAADMPFERMLRHMRKHRRTNNLHIILSCCVLLRNCPQEHKVTEPQASAWCTSQAFHSISGNAHPVTWDGRVGIGNTGVKVGAWARFDSQYIGEAFKKKFQLCLMKCPFRNASLSGLRFDVIHSERTFSEVNRFNIILSVCVPDWPCSENQGWWRLRGTSAPVS